MNQDSNGEDIYSILANAPGHPLLWNRFLNELARQLNCESSCLLITDLIDSKNTRFLFSANIHRKYLEQYETTLNKLDTFNHFIGKNPRRVFYNKSINFDSIEESKNQFLAPNNQSNRFGVSIPCNHNHALSLLINRKSAFDEVEQQHVTEVLQKIIPALSDAIHAEQRHKINSQLLHYIGDHFDAYIIVDPKLNIIFSEPVFTSIINQMDCIEISGNRFSIKNPAIERRLQSLIENTEYSASIHNQCHSCQITLIPISYLKNLYQWECYKDGFILTFTHEKEKNPVIERLTEIYHLSMCEAVCALHFMKTPSISDIAANTYRSQETVRNHIKHTMQKMEVHSQAELMKKLITLAAL